MKNLYIILVLGVALIGNAQHRSAQKQTKSVLIVNATAHLGNEKVIEKSIIGFKEGKIVLVADANTIKESEIVNYDTKIDASGKHIYPGFIAPNSTLGLVEVDAVKASDDENEIGAINPNIKSLVAYNAESRVIETVRPNGILTAQITPRGGRISGTSSVVQLDAWSWQDAVIRENDGIHLNFPSTTVRRGWWTEPGSIEVNKEYFNELEKLKTFLQNAKAYVAETSKDRNLIYESTAGLFNAKQTLFIHANQEKQMIDAVQLSKDFGIKNLVFVGGYEAYKITDLLKKNAIPVLINRIHSMPEKDHDDVDLPYKLAKLLTDKGILVGLENSGDMERMNTRNLPFLAGTCVAYGMEKEKALQLITSNTAKILGIDNLCGTLEVGKDATLFISEGDALDMRTNKLTEAYIQGRKIQLENHQTKLNTIYKEKYGQN
jgi:imidazolonepropionase-like amidohydrolase